MKHVIKRKDATYVRGLGIVEHKALTQQEEKDLACLFVSQMDAEDTVAAINDWVEEEAFEAVPYVADVARPRVRRFPVRHFYAAWLAKKCLLSEDFAERKLPQVLGHNKRPDTLIFMMQLAQRYPIFSEKLKAKHP